MQVVCLALITIWFLVNYRGGGHKKLLLSQLQCSILYFDCHSERNRRIYPLFTSIRLYIHRLFTPFRVTGGYFGATISAVYQRVIKSACCFLWAGTLRILLILRVFCCTTLIMRSLIQPSHVIQPLTVIQTILVILSASEESITENNKY